VTIDPVIGRLLVYEEATFVLVFLEWF
jgi:hypothetical protein